MAAIKSLFGLYSLSNNAELSNGILLILGATDFSFFPMRIIIFVNEYMTNEHEHEILQNFKQMNVKISM